MQIVRIDQVVSTATMLPGEVIGFLYTTQDGSTWLGQRTKDYQSAADATAINRVLAAAHVAGDNVTEFPPTSLYGVPTKHQQLFRVQMPAERVRHAADCLGSLRNLAVDPATARPTNVR